jgi:IS30 family transposase
LTGDFILGAQGARAIGTLVELTTRFVVMVHMPARKADVASSAFAGALNAIPTSLRKTITYDTARRWPVNIEQRPTAFAPQLEFALTI